MQTSTAVAAQESTGRQTPMTRLAQFIAKENISISKLSRVADVNLSYLHALKNGKSEPTRIVMEKLRRAAGVIVGRDAVSVTELFDFGA